MFTKVAELKSMEVGGEHARRVIADLHRIASSPEEQPFQLTVTKQSVRAEVPDKKNSEHVTHSHLNECVFTTTEIWNIRSLYWPGNSTSKCFTPHMKGFLRVSDF